MNQSGTILSFKSLKLLGPPPYMLSTDRLGEYDTKKCNCDANGVLCTIFSMFSVFLTVKNRMPHAAYGKYVCCITWGDISSFLEKRCIIY